MGNWGWNIEAINLGPQCLWLGTQCQGILIGGYIHYTESFALCGDAIKTFIQGTVFVTFQS